MPPTHSGTAVRTRILLLVAALITYGSLYPFHFTVPPSHAAAWIKMFQDWSLITSKGDMVGNIVLFLPFGLAGVFAIAGQTTSPRITTLALLGFALAFVLQIAQIYFPPRTPSIADVFWNMAGMALGIYAGLSLRQQLHARWQGWRPAYAIPVALLALWISAELLPFVPSLDFQAIKNSVKALLRMHLAPPDVIWHAAGALVAGRALAAIFGVPRSSWLLAVLLAAVAAGKVIVVTRVLNAPTLLGFALGYAGWHILSRRDSLQRDEW